MRIISANLNGIRSAYKKGFLDYLAAADADFVCVQELTGQEADLADDMKRTAPGIAPKNAATAALPFTAAANPTACKPASAWTSSTAKAASCAPISAA